MFPRVVNLLSTQRHKGVFVPLSSNEAKTQANGIHTCIWFGYAQKLQTLISSREWEALTGDSFIVDVRPMYGEIDGFLETFKYALKFSDLELSDNLHAYKTLKGKRLINSFGALRGVEVPEELTDDDLDDDLPYMLMLYTYRKGSGYNFSEQWTEDLSWNITSKAPKATGFAQGNGYTQNQSEAYAFTRPNVAVCFQSDGCTLLRQS